MILKAEGNNFLSRLSFVFDAMQHSLNGQKELAINKLRAEAFQFFKEKNLHTLKAEDWKYTNVGFLNRFDFAFLSAASSVNLTKEQIDSYKIPDLKANILVFYNGFYIENLSEIISSKGVKISSLKNAINANYDDISSKMNQNLDFENNIFNAINTAFFTDGVCIEVEKNAIIENAIHIMNIVDTSDDSIVANIRNIVIAGENSIAKVIQTNHTISDNKATTIIVNELHIAKSANLEHNILQNDTHNSVQFVTTNTHQKEKSVYTNNTFCISGQFIRNTLTTTLEGEYSTSNLNGFYYGNNQNVIDNHTKVDHAVPNCESNELYKGILTDKAIGIFNGKILVRPDAQKTNAYQSSKNILLSDDAKVNTKPELEIYADDVKCSHGASTGSIDKDALFYLRARGIDRSLAMELLLNAYSHEITEKLTIPELESFIMKQIEDKFKF